MRKNPLIPWTLAHQVAETLFLLVGPTGDDFLNIEFLSDYETEWLGNEEFAAAVRELLIYNERFRYWGDDDGPPQTRRPPK